MNLSKQRTIPAMALLLFVGIIIVGGSTVYAGSVQDCLDIGIASCEIEGFETLCKKLFSNPQPCEKLCRSIVGDDKKVGACVICCENVKGQLDLEE